MICDRGSPPKQTLLVQRFNEEIKGDKYVPDTGDLGQDPEVYEEGEEQVEDHDQSYEQVRVELFDDKQVPVQG